MRIWVDDDACPAPIREILFRAAQRESVPLTLVANRPVRAPPSPLIRSVQVAGGFDAADREITRNVAPGDLVITADIPLAADVVAAGAVALNPRGELYTEANVRERLAMRDISEELRSIGKGGGGPPKLGQRERQSFAKQLDRLLSAARRGRFP